MLSSGDVVEIHLSVPEGREVGSAHRAVVVMAQRALEGAPSVVQVVPLTTRARALAAEVAIEPDETNGLDSASSAQCQHIRAVSARRITGIRGSVGPVVLAQIRKTIALIIDLPT